MFTKFSFIHYTLVLLIVAGISCSCGKTRRSYKVSGEFRYYNQFGNTVRITVRSGLTKALETYAVAVGDSLVLSTTGETDQKNEEVNPQGYAPALLADTTTVRFNDSVCYNEYNKNGAVLHNIASYTYRKRADKDYIFFFTIDSSLYKQGGTCY